MSNNLFKKKIPRKIDDVIDVLIKIVFILILLMGIYISYDKFYLYNTSNNKSLLYSTELQMEEINRIYPKAIGWIYIEDTIDEPIMQGKTNNEYLNKGPDDKYSLRGSIFLDSRNNENFTDEYSLLYGHHMEQGQMFGALDKYLSQDYWTEKHTTGILTLKDNKKITFKIFGIATIDASEKETFQPTEIDITKVKTNLKEKINYKIEHLNEIKDFDKKKIVCLSTCQSPETTYRTCVFAVIEN